jgi:succinate dehydrogenase / fumarate reductase cytochrome b subunit
MHPAPRSNPFSTTVAKELLLAISGLVLVGFIAGHLAGNLLIFAGPEVFNAYAQKLADMGPLLWVTRIGLLAALTLHIKMAVTLSRQSRLARTSRYAVDTNLGPKTRATRFMLLSGIIILCFLFLHLYDFTFGDKVGPATIVPGMNSGESLGLYGLVWNGFANPLRALIYILAVSAIGLHLSHAISSVLVTLGLLSEKATPKVDCFALILGLGTGLGFATIPLYVLIRTYIYTGGTP